MFKLCEGVRGVFVEFKVVGLNNVTQKVEGHGEELTLFQFEGDIRLIKS